MMLMSFIGLSALSVRIRSIAETTSIPNQNCQSANGLARTLSSFTFDHTTKYGVFVVQSRNRNGRDEELDGKERMWLEQLEGKKKKKKKTDWKGEVNSLNPCFTPANRLCSLLHWPWTGCPADRAAAWGGTRPV